MTNSNPSVFISYRREGGADVARLLQNFLESKSFSVFLDVDNLDAGHFDEQLFAKIQQHDVFLMVCSPNALDRCTDSADWVRQEIAHALQCRKRIIPVTLQGFKCPSPESLPAEMAEFAKYQAFEYHPVHWKSTSAKLLEMLRANIATEIRVQAPGDSTFPVWAQTCLALLGMIRRAVEERDRAEWTLMGAPGEPESNDYVVLEEPDDELPRLKLPLDVDTDELYEPVRSLVRRGHELDRPLVPFATRLRNGKELIRRVLVSRNPKLSDALFEAHLLNLVAVIRLYSERHETPDATLEEAVSRAAKDATPSNEWSRPRYELNTLLQMALNCLEFEIQLIANPPDPSQIADACSRGTLAYSAEWRDRLHRFVADQGDGFAYAVPPDFTAPVSADARMPLLWDWLRFYHQSRLLSVAAELLIDPAASLATAADREPDAFYRLHVSISDDPYVIARGAWRIVELVSPMQLSHESELTDHYLSKLLNDSLGIVSTKARRSSPSGHSLKWGDITCSPKAERLAALCMQLQCPDRSFVEADRLAGFFFASIASIPPANLREWLRCAAAMCFNDCIHHGTTGRKYWKPSAESREAAVRTLLWINLFLCVDPLARSPWPRDSILVAAASDSGMSALRDALRFYESIVGRATLERMTEELALVLDTAPEHLKGRIPLRTFCATVPDPKRIASAVGILLDPPDDENPI